MAVGTEREGSQLVGQVHRVAGRNEKHLMISAVGILLTGMTCVIDFMVVKFSSWFSVLLLCQRKKAYKGLNNSSCKKSLVVGRPPIDIQ